MSHQSVVDEIKSRLPIEEYIDHHLALTRRGSIYQTHCPFHTEKTPSFVVFPKTQTWHCFGSCGSGGDLFSFVQRREGLTFPEALAVLAREANVHLPEDTTTANQELQAQKTRLRELCAAAAQFYASLLWQKQGLHILVYLTQRGLTEETIHHFALGYAPAGWGNLTTALQARGYTVEDMIAVGLARQREEGVGDYFYQRVIIPIRDAHGHVIGFGARALNDQQTPKYLNTPQSVLFEKGQTLFGLDMARDALREQGAVVTEGYFDVITAHQHGYRNVVGVMGTAITVHHLREIHRWTPKVRLAMDADAAGNRATERSTDVLLDYYATQQGSGKVYDYRVIPIPDGHDVDSLIRETDTWQQTSAEAVPLVEFLIRQRVAAADLTNPANKQTVIAAVAPLLQRVTSSVERTTYIQTLAVLLKAREQDISRELARGQQRSTQATPANDATLTPLVPLLPRAESYLLYLLLLHPTVADALSDSVAMLPVGLWTSPLLRGIAEHIQHQQTPETMGVELHDMTHQIYGMFEALPPPPDDVATTHVRYLIQYLLREYDQQQIAYLTALLTDAEGADTEEQTEILNRIWAIRRKWAKSNPANT